MLTDKRVLVTGAGGGIGREIAVEAARQGAAWVTVADLNPAAAAETAEMVAGVGARAHAVAVDLADSAQVRRMVEEAVAAGGGLDTLVNNAGVLDSAFTDTPTVEELPEGLRLPAGVKPHGLKSMNAPFASGSNPPDVMVVIPCTLGTLGRIAHGYSEDVLLRAADVVLKERKKLILVPRETPLSLVHVRNFELLLLAGAVILPANPSFYARPQNIGEVVDTVVARVLDHIGVPNRLVPRWAEEKE